MHSSLMGDLAIVMVVAAVTGLVARRLGQPSVLGYLFAGLIVGPYIPVPLFADPHRMEELAEVGVVLVMLAIGLEFRVRRLAEILPMSGFTAAVQMGSMATAGFALGSMMGWTTEASVALAACIAISSTMVVSVVLRANPVEDDVRSHVFGVLVVQDVVAIGLIAMVTALAAGQDVGPWSLAVLALQLTGAVVALLVAGLLLMPRVVRWAADGLDAEAIVVVVAAAGFGFAMAAESFGYSVALGAFIAGMAVAEAGREHVVEAAVEPLRAVFSALFFVSIGMAVDPVVAWSTLPLALVLAAIVVVVQLVSVTLGGLLSGGSLRKSIHAGLTLGQIGELSFVIASIAIGGGILPDEALPALVTVATITAFTTPALLARAEAIVTGVDRWLPKRLNTLLTAYQAFLRRATAPGEASALRRPLVALVLDWGALVMLLVLWATVVPAVDPGWRWAMPPAFVVVSLPFVVGLGRSGWKFAVVVRGTVEQGAFPPAMARAIESTVMVAVVVFAWATMMAIGKPVIGSASLDIASAGALLGAGVWMLTRAGDADGEYTSGVARVVVGIAHQIGDDGPAHVETSSPLAGIDATPVSLDEGAFAVGRSLSELNLRCRTGATVVAVRRSGQVVALPTGSERMASGDVVSVSGSEEAIARAVAVLTEAPSAVSPA